VSDDLRNDALEAQLAALAESAEGAESALAVLARALFPAGDATVERMTWPEPIAARPAGDSETRLRHAEKRYRMLLEQIPAVTFMAELGDGKNEIYVSPHIEHLLGYTQSEWLEEPFLWFERLHPDDRDLLNDEFARGCRTGGPFRAQCRFLARDGRVVWVHGEARLIKDDAGRPLVLQGVAFDITENKRAEEKLRGIVESAPDATVIVDHHGRIVLVNSQLERLFGYTRAELLMQPVEILVPDGLRERHASIRTAYLASPRYRSMGAGLEIVARRKDGVELPVEISLGPLATDEGTMVSAAIRDISERKQIERRIIASLHEKEALLKEIHHRVKNNLTVISSLFFLESRQTQDTPTIRLLQESQDRIRSMALVHDILYHSENFAAVDFADYAVTLGRELLHSYRLPDRHVELRTELEPVAMSIDLAVPCGLILNELLTNALKHAFPEQARGAIRIILRRDSDQCTLAVLDDGVGIAAPAEPAPPTLGLRIIRSLARQVDGRFELGPAHPGTAARLTLKLAGAQAAAPGA
jgi:PAS domain S-box-containing protein